jgi:cysteine synthase A
MQSRLRALANLTRASALSSSTRLISRQLSLWQQPKSSVHTQVMRPLAPTITPAITIQKHIQHIYSRPPNPQLTAWQQEAIRTLQEEQKNCPETPIYFLCAIDGVDIYAKDERKQPTGSHKHRLARSLFLQALRQGFINENTILVEAASGGTASSEAYFAKLLNLPYTAVVNRDTPKNKLDAITARRGLIVECEPGQDKTVAATLGKQSGWYFIDQFANAALATDKENNIASELVQQFKKHNIAMPRYVVCGASTGGTSATLGGYFQQHGFDNTEVIVGDPENSAYTLAFQTGDKNVTTRISSRIGGIGRPHVEPSFDLTKIKEVMAVPDAASIAASHFLNNVFELLVGPSTGTNLFASLELVERMRQRGEKGSVLMFIFDEGHLYSTSCYNPAWLKMQKINILPYLQQMYDVFGNFSDKKDILARQAPRQTSPMDRFQPIQAQEVLLFHMRQEREEKIACGNHSFRPS